MNESKDILKRVLIAPLLLLIFIYRNFISPWTPASCRFQPTCSAYTQEALKKHGLFKGAKLALKRILSCHPWGRSGYDPVPECCDKNKNCTEH